MVQQLVTLEHDNWYSIVHLRPFLLQTGGIISDICYNFSWFFGRFWENEMSCTCIITNAARLVNCSFLRCMVTKEIIP